MTSSALSSDVDAVRTLLEAWASAVRSHDLPGVVAQHHDDIVFFDVPEPPALRGIHAYEQAWPPFFRYIGTTGQFELDELAVTAGSDVAFAHALLLVRGELESVPARVRLSVGLRKIDGTWWVAHEHHSAPYASG
jgi:ketosteroid isomerase-like protein